MIFIALIGIKRMELLSLLVYIFMVRYCSHGF
jgi:hypothetical protein